MNQQTISDRITRRDFLRAASALGAAAFAGAIPTGIADAAVAPVARVGGPRLKVSRRRNVCIRKL